MTNLSASNVSERFPKFKLIMDSIRPDILVCQDIASNRAVAGFAKEVMTGYVSIRGLSLRDTDSDPYFRHSYPTGNVIFYHGNRFEGLTHGSVGGNPRVSEFFRLRLKATGDTLLIHCINFMEGNNTKDSIGRMNAAFQFIQTTFQNDVIRKDIIVAGSMNIYSPSEIAYLLVASEYDMPRMVDPLGSKWARNESRYAKFYTYAQHQTDIACGGAAGGMRDRFDYLFLSRPMHQKLINGSYTHFGNDGVPRLNASVDIPPNRMHSAELATALRIASDHVPVYADFIFGQPTIEEEQPSGAAQESENYIGYYDLAGRSIPKPTTSGAYYKMVGSTIEAFVLP